MKLSKVLLSTAVIAAAMTAFAACSADDDGEDSPKGVYTLSEKNDKEMTHDVKVRLSGDAYEAFLVKMSFDEEKSQAKLNFDSPYWLHINDRVGFIFGYKDKGDRADFNVFSVERDTGKWWLDRYINISNLSENNEENFGTALYSASLANCKDPEYTEPGHYLYRAAEDLNYFDETKKDVYLLIYQSKHDDGIVRFEIYELSAEEYESIQEVDEETGKIMCLNNGELVEFKTYKKKHLGGYPAFTDNVTPTRSGIYAEICGHSLFDASWDIKGMKKSSFN